MVESTWTKDMQIFIVPYEKVQNLGIFKRIEKLWFLPVTHVYSPPNYAYITDLIKTSKAHSQV